MPVDARRLRVLLEVHRAGGIVAAAAGLRVTPSAVSQQIARLEGEVGLVVLDRQPGGSVLTAAGRALVETAERIEGELTDVVRRLAALESEVVGRVVLGGFQSVVQVVLAPLVLELRERLPGVEVEVVEVGAEEGQSLLRSGSIDLLLVEADSPAGRTTPRAMRDVPVLDDPWLVALPAGTPVPDTMHDLADHTWLGVDPAAAAHQATADALRGLDPAPQVAHSYAGIHAAISMVAAGLGVALLPGLAVHGARSDERIVAVRLTGLRTRSIVARHRVTRAEPRREVQAVLEELLLAANRLPMRAMQ